MSAEGSHTQSAIGPQQVVRIIQWMFGVPIAYSFIIALVGVELFDPALILMKLVVPSTWWARVALAGVAAFIEVSDTVVVKIADEYNSKIYEVLKGIGDQLRGGAAVESAVAESIMASSGPTEVFKRAVDLSDAMPFEDALRAAADECGNAYLQEVSYLVAEAVSSDGDSGSAVRRLGMELERNATYESSIRAKIATPLMVMRGIGLFAVPPIYALLRNTANGSDFAGSEGVEPGARFFFLYGALAIGIYDWLVFGQWERLFARLPLGVGAVYLGLHWTQSNV